MWFDGIRQPNTIYVASVSRGKDSTAMLRAIQLLGFPLDVVCSCDIWFDDDTPAELPPMVDFKNKWDNRCLEEFGIPVTRVCATNQNGEKLTYCDYFYKNVSPERLEQRKSLYSSKQGISLYGFPTRKGPWCNGHLKTGVLSNAFKSYPNVVMYLGIAADEPERINRHINKSDIVLPLVQIGWDEELCGLEAVYLDMLSPTYSSSFRDGCFFCHNQGIEQLRQLRHNYPELWGKLLKLDSDSPTTFHADGHTVHDFDRRFALEDEGLIDPQAHFRWTMLDDDCLNYSLFTDWMIKRG